MLQKKNRGKKKIFKILTTAAGLFALCALGFFGIIVASFYSSLPSADQINNRRVSQSTKIYDRSGEVLLYEIHGEEKRTVIPDEAIPKYVKEATISIEDQNFYNHPAFDWRGTLRAVAKDVLNLSKEQGGSTITQQLAKNAFLSGEKTISRKIKELMLAIVLERHYTKDQILDLYLNQVPYGSNAYGIEAAAKTFFGKSAKELTLAESALLASLVQAPTYYSPWGSHTDELMQRKNIVLEQMAALGYITKENAQKTKAEKLKFSPQFTSIKAPHFVMAVQDYLAKKYGNDTLENGGLKVITTLDWNLQQIAEAAVSDGAKRNEELYKGKNAALFAEDPKTGQVLAVVGSRDYFDIENEGNFNVATQGLRQPGSAFKPLAYVTAFKKGLTPETVIFDTETEFDATGIPSKSYKPQNYDEKFRGPISLRNALAQSINIPAVKVMYLAGIDNVLKTAKDFGITTLTERSRYGLSLVLGGGEVKLSEMVGAYSVFANEGKKHDQTLILSIEDAGGQMLEKYEDRPSDVMDPQYTRLINDILSDSVARSPLYSSSLGLTLFDGHDVALKTGTTNNYVDAWAIGYTPAITIGVWAGNNHREPLQKRGGSILAALPIWSEVMGKALKNQTAGELFTKPESLAVSKPIFRGDYLANKQIHTILYYLDKNNPLGPYPTQPESDPQFQNWEIPVLNWARSNLLNFESYNQAAVSMPDVPAVTAIKINSPQKGDFVKDNFAVNFTVTSSDELKSVEIYFNDSLVEKISISGISYVYQKNIFVQNLDTQNLVSIRAINKNGQETREGVIVFK